jgi:hypothetical protein
LCCPLPRKSKPPRKDPPSVNSCPSLEPQKQDAV